MDDCSSERYAMVYLLVRCSWTLAGARRTGPARGSAWPLTGQRPSLARQGEGVSGAPVRLSAAALADGVSGPRAVVAQLVERKLPKLEVAGSRPVRRFSQPNRACRLASPPGEPAPQAGRDAATSAWLARDQDPRQRATERGAAREDPISYARRAFSSDRARSDLKRSRRGLVDHGYPCAMATVVLDPYAYELDALKERRRVSGLDRLDEVWEGVLHMVPAPSFEHASIAQQLAVALNGRARAAGLVPAMHEFNLGDSIDDFRVPDGGLHRPGAGGVWLHTAALVVEIVSPGDETWLKLPFYAAHEVDEVLIVDPAERAVHWLGLADGGEYRPIERSGVIDLGAAELAEHIDWP